MVRVLNFVFLCALSATAGRVESHRFVTTSPPPAYKVPPALARNDALFRAGLQTLPEGLLVMGALGLAHRPLGLDSEQNHSLSPQLAKTYAQIHQDADFANVTSALPYCFSLQRPTTGHYFMYRPDALSVAPTCMSFCMAGAAISNFTCGL